MFLNINKINIENYKNDMKDFLLEIRNSSNNNAEIEIIDDSIMMIVYGAEGSKTYISFYGDGLFLEVDWDWRLPKNIDTSGTLKEAAASINYSEILKNMPDYVSTAIGEATGDEVKELIEAMRAGHEGSHATISTPTVCAPLRIKKVAIDSVRRYFKV